ncbi:hypothetical protein BCR36DRAFT_583030 [Piromyces finnis]|uniref:Uncharacterized protein n=1 Tax=Piromyces finnis TaxID=1754191 RepID=A0A1Y1VC07_9FUNG|nr:hypothetical protein BCR36DRAFT_583030 [Piromyces finnis]|eukprot:ORX51481.1 hypothetical protein BCR36DRAFT_583030 [Piromyces finnis]
MTAAIGKRKNTCNTSSSERQPKKFKKSVVPNLEISPEDIELFKHILSILSFPVRPCACLQIKKETIFKSDKKPLQYKPMRFLTNLLVDNFKNSKTKKIKVGEIIESSIIQKVLYKKNDNSDKKENDKEEKNIIEIPIVFSKEFLKWIKTSFPSQNATLYLLTINNFKSDKKFENEYKNYTSKSGEVKKVYNNIIECKKIFDFSENEEEKKLPLQLRGNDNKTRNIYSLLILGDNRKGIIFSPFTTSEYKDYIQRTNENTRIYYWVKNNDIISFLKHVNVLIHCKMEHKENFSNIEEFQKTLNNSEIEFKENFDFPLEYNSFEMNSQLQLEEDIKKK